VDGGRELRFGVGPRLLGPAGGVGRRPTGSAATAAAESSAWLELAVDELAADWALISESRLLPRGDRLRISPAAASSPRSRAAAKDSIAATTASTDPKPSASHRRFSSTSSSDVGSGDAGKMGLRAPGGGGVCPLLRSFLKWWRAAAAAPAMAAGVSGALGM
jgi:hypothetical protein